MSNRLSKTIFDLFPHEPAQIKKLRQRHGIEARHVVGLRCSICKTDAYVHLDVIDRLYCKTHFKEYCKQIELNR